MRALVLLGASVCCACGPLTPPRTDGGTGGGGVTGGGGGTITGGGGGGGVTGGGGGSTTGGGGGSTTGSGGGSTTGGGGGTTDGGDGIWDFGTLTLSPAPTNSGAIVGFAETDAGIWAMSGSGRLYRSTGGPFTEVLAFAGLQPLDFEASASGHFFIVTTVHFLECAADCADAGAWSDRLIAATDEVLDSLCVIADDHVLAVGSKGNGNDGVSYRWDGAIMGATATTLGASRPDNCWQGASGDFFIPADDNVVRYSSVAESFALEPAGPFLGWRGGGSSPGHEWVTGGGPTIAERGGSNWTNVYTPSGLGSTITTVIGISPTLAFAFGGGPSSSGQAGYRFNGTAWSAITPDVPVLNIAFSAFRSSSGAVYVGGYDANQLPVIIRGARR